MSEGNRGMVFCTKKKQSTAALSSIVENITLRPHAHGRCMAAHGVVCGFVLWSHRHAVCNRMVLHSTLPGYYTIAISTICDPIKHAQFRWNWQKQRQKLHYMPPEAYRGTEPTEIYGCCITALHRSHRAVIWQYTQVLRLLVS